jgi:hypothetical protein
MTSFGHCRIREQESPVTWILLEEGPNNSAESAYMTFPQKLNKGC